MQVDKTTLEDLSIFSHDEAFSVFHFINFSRTVGGREWLRMFLSSPLDNIEQIIQTQDVIKIIIDVHSQWPEGITNGTIMMIEKFYESSVEHLPQNANHVTAFFYKVLNISDYSLVRFSVNHYLSFINGLYKILQLLSEKKLPGILQTLIGKIQHQFAQVPVSLLLKQQKEKISTAEVIRYGSFIRYHLKEKTKELIEVYSKLDAYFSMATACKKYNFSFPLLVSSDKPFLTAKQLYHPLLSNAVAYDIELTDQQNFLFLTGANMAGKSTFIKAVGVGTYLAHIGMGVPAAGMELSLFDGLLSNIQVADNIVQGESYFYNEVQRVKKTIEKIYDGKKWLILIDELFKGTNVQDAMKCSTVVIEGLLKMRNALFILSTHLYEIGEELKQYPNIRFQFFETDVKDEQLLFTYKLKEGISNDRLGYLILKREGIVEMLSKLEL